MSRGERATSSDFHFPVKGVIKPSFNGFVDLHTHLSGDTADPPEQILRMAKKRGLTGLAVTDHDSTRRLPVYRAIIEKLGLDLEIFPGVESTAVIPDKKGVVRKSKPKHVLAIFDSSTEDIPEIPCYMPAPELNEFVHELGGKTSVAHPGMGNFSVTLREILAIQGRSKPEEHFDYVEGHHGGVLNLIRFSQQNPRLASILLRVGLLPQVVDTNKLTRKTFEQKGNEGAIKGMTAGSDAHSTEHIGDVGVVYNREQGLFSAIESGDSALVQKKHTRPPWTAREVIRGTIGGWRMEYDRRKGKNGFSTYKGLRAIS